MRIAGLAFGLFLAAFLLHWIIWRIRIPRRQSAALLVIFLGMLPAGLLLLAFLPGLAGLAAVGPWQCLHVAVFHVAMTIGYVVNYSGLEGRSPSMTLLVFVADARGKGRTREELFDVLRGDCPVETRLEAMIRDNMVTCQNGTYVLTTKGCAWARVFGQWRDLLNLPKGG